MAQQAVIDIVADVAQICRQAPTPTLIAAYVRAARRLCLGSRWLVASIDGVTGAGDKNYSLGSDTYAEIFGLAGITLYRSADDPVVLIESDSALWNPADDNGVPELYQYLPEAQVTLHKTPGAIYDITFGAVITPKRGATSIDARLCTKWEYALQDGALAYLLSLPNVAWTDAQEAKMREARFLGHIQSAANAASIGFNPGATPLRSVPLEY